MHDSTSVKTPFEGSIRANLNADIKGMKIGLPKEYFGAGISDAVRESVLAAAETYKSLGAEAVSYTHLRRCRRYGPYL